MKAVSILTIFFLSLATVSLVVAFYFNSSRKSSAAIRKLVQTVSAPAQIAAARKLFDKDLLSLIVRGRYEAKISEWSARLADEQQAISEFRRYKLFSIFASIFLILIALPDSMLLMVLAVFVFAVPDLLLYNKVEKHKIDVRNSIPETVELLSLCVDAGLTLTAALNRVGTMQGGVMGAELDRLLREVRLGVAPAAAFQALAERTGEEQIYRLVNALNQVERMGAPISVVLKEQGSEFREIRRARARESAQKVPVKILAPIMLCFLPALMIIVLAPAVMGIMSTFSGS